MKLEYSDVDTDDLTTIVERDHKAASHKPNGEIDEKHTVISSGIYKTPDRENPYIVVYLNKRHNINYAIEAESISKAQLIFGLFGDLPSNHRSEVTLPNEFYQGISESTVPTAVALGGKESIAAYFKILFDTTQTINTRSKTAMILEVEEQTVSNYWNRTRWDGCIECLSENTDLHTVNIDGDHVGVVECNDCGYYFVNAEDKTQSTHQKQNINCTDKLKRAVGSLGDDQYELWRCAACGFYTAESNRHRTETVERLHQH